jgi:hypothetical protein
MTVFCQSRRRLHGPNDLTVTPTATLQERREWLRGKYNGKPPASVEVTLRLVEIELGWREHQGGRNGYA